MNIRTLNLKQSWNTPVAFLLIFITLLILILNISQLPDYEIYSNIYRDSTLGGKWEILFVALNYYSKYIGLTYEIFRFLLYIFCLGSLYFFLVQLSKFRKSQKSNLITIFSFIFYLFVLSVFILEFFIIRIRAGLSIALIILGIGIALSSSKIIFRTLVVLLAFVLAFFIHKSTTVILVFMIGMPALGVTLNRRTIFGSQRQANILLVFLAAALLYSLVFTQTQERSGQVVSLLNPVRFFAIGVVPFLLFLCFYWENIKHFSLPRFENLRTAFDFFYFALSSCLIVITVFGISPYSGEAIVRFLTLYSLPSLILLYLVGNLNQAPIAAYLALINALFFLNTIGATPYFLKRIFFH
jgi:hypothetical protein